MRADPRLVLPLWCSLACVSQAPQRNSAWLVELRKEPPDSGFREVEAVSCEAHGPNRRAECVETLRLRAYGADADVVVVQSEEDGADGVRMKALAYRRTLPYETLQRTGRAFPKASPKATVGSGTGFIVDSKGTILTAFHVVAGARTIHVTLADGRQAVARIDRRNESADIAVLKIAEETRAYLPVGNSADAKIGMSVWTLGYPMTGWLGLEPKFTDGTMSALSGINGAPEVYQVTVPIQPGNSGGPLVDDRGVVFGIMTSTAAALPFFEATGTLPQGVNWAVKSDYANGLFDPPPPAAHATSRQEAVQRVRDALCFVEAVHGDGIPTPNKEFGKGLTPKSMTESAYSKLRDRCEADDRNACLSVAMTLVEDCGVKRTDECKDARFGRVMVEHACAVGQTSACTIVRKASLR